MILLVLTLVFIVIQNVVGVVTASAIGENPAIGVLAGSTSLIGGHGTAIAWAPEVAKLGIDNALEIGIASATLGLIIASLIGGPISKLLIGRHHLESTSEEMPVVGLPHENEAMEEVNHFSIMRVILVMHLCMIIGYIAHQQILAIDFSLPLFVPCLLVGIILSNTIPAIFSKVVWPARTRALAMVSDFSLGLFLAMTLMSMKLWELASLAGPLLIILVFQTLVAFCFIIFVLFKLMGKDYQAAVLSAGFGGFSLGATPVAIANMTAVTKTHGPAPMAFIMLPLVGAFFVDVHLDVGCFSFLLCNHRGSSGWKSAVVFQLFCSFNHSDGNAFTRRRAVLGGGPISLSLRGLFRASGTGRSLRKIIFYCVKSIHLSSCSVWP